MKQPGFDEQEMLHLAAMLTLQVVEEAQERDHEPILDSMLTKTAEALDKPWIASTAFKARSKARLP